MWFWVVGTWSGFRTEFEKKILVRFFKKSMGELGIPHLPNY